MQNETQIEIFHLLITFDRYDELRYNAVDLVATGVQQVLDALPGVRLVRVLRLRQAVEEKRQVQRVVQLLDVHRPGDSLAAGQILHANGQITAIEVHAERGGTRRQWSARTLGDCGGGVWRTRRIIE